MVSVNGALAIPIISALRYATSMSSSSATTTRSRLGHRRRDRFIALILAVALPLVLGGAGGVVTAAAIPGWYAGLSKPPWNPPSWVFGPVWTTLYLLMGVASWRVWRSQLLAGAGPRAQQRVRSALVTYSGQLALNAVWSPVFFGLKRIDLGFFALGRSTHQRRGLVLARAACANPARADRIRPDAGLEPSLWGHAGRDGLGE